MTEDEVGKQVVDAAVQVHQELGPGLLETVYDVVFAHELRRRGFRIERQVAIPVEYRGLSVKNKVIVELMCVEKLNNTHKKQLLIYLRLADKRLGFLLNFGEALMKHGITRTVNRLPEQAD